MQDAYMEYEKVNFFDPIVTCKHSIDLMVWGTKKTNLII